MCHFAGVSVGLLPWIFALGGLSLARPEEATAISIEFDSPAGCSSADSFFEGIRSRTSKVKLAKDGHAVSLLRIRLFRAGTKIKGELRLSDLEGEKETRKVDGATCDEVVEALALTVTLALDPDAFISRMSPRDGQLTSAPTLTGPPKPPVSAAQPSQSGSTSQWELGVRWAAASVVLPGLSFGPAIRLAYFGDPPEFGPFSLGVSLSYLRNDLLSSPEYGEFGLASLGVEFCPLRSRLAARFGVGLCALGAGGWLSAKGLAIDHPESTRRSWWEAGIGGLAVLKLRGRLTLGANLGATIPLFRREFTVNGQPEIVAHSPTVALHGALGFDYRF